MRTILIILGIFVATECSAQTLAMYPGLSYGGFYDIQKSEGDYTQEYDPQFGFNLGVEIKDIALDSVYKIALAVNYQRYGGGFYTQGTSYSYTYDQGTITKHVLGLEFYPINIHLFNNLRWSLGLSLNTLLTYKMYGKRIWSSNYPYGPSGNVDLNDIDGFVKRFYWGVNSTIGYEFEVGNIRFEPRYSYYLGLTEEFDHLQAATKSMRYSIQLSFGYSLK